uniref:Vacuolar ATPase assembly protein VMA22 n=1 Tax=Seriola lalandi dorsalis TaxID=1841481 RepID=A0A3B4WVJ0_SERLL
MYLVYIHRFFLRRNKPQKDITEKEANDKARSQKAPEVTPVKRSDQNPQQDPLKWFGILVPQSLKQAQSSFKQGIVLRVQTSVYFIRFGFKVRP